MRFTPFAATFGVLPFEEAAAVYLELGEEAFNLFTGMSVLDALTANDDRHLNNFGFLFDNASRRVTGAAPVFFTASVPVNRYCGSTAMVRVKTSPAPLSQVSTSGVSGVSFAPAGAVQSVFGPGTCAAVTPARADQPCTT